MWTGYNWISNLLIWNEFPRETGQCVHMGAGKLRGWPGLRAPTNEAQTYRPGADSHPDEVWVRAHPVRVQDCEETFERAGRRDHLLKHWGGAGAHAPALPSQVRGGIGGGSQVLRFHLRLFVGPYPWRNRSAKGCHSAHYHHGDGRSRVYEQVHADVVSDYDLLYWVK